MKIMKLFINNNGYSNRDVCMSKHSQQIGRPTCTMSAYTHPSVYSACSSPRQASHLLPMTLPHVKHRTGIIILAREKPVPCQNQNQTPQSRAKIEIMFERRRDYLADYFFGVNRLSPNRSYQTIIIVQSCLSDSQHTLGQLKKKKRILQWLRSFELFFSYLRFNLLTYCSRLIDINLRNCLSGILQCSLPDDSWYQAMIPFRLGGQEFHDLTFPDEVKLQPCQRSNHLDF